MKKSENAELSYSFHNPNNQEELANALLKLAACNLSNYILENKEAKF